MSVYAAENRLRKWFTGDVHTKKYSRPLQKSGMIILRYCSLVMSREVFCVSKGHRKPETYRANLCDQHKFCASQSVLLRTE